MQLLQCAYYSFSNGLMDTMLPKDALLRRCKCSADQLCPPRLSLKPPSTLMTMAHIARVEGPAALFAGLPPTLLVAIPSTALYFTAYEAVLARLRAAFPDQSTGALAMAAGGVARMGASTLASPFEVVRVQMQAVANAPPFRSYMARVWRGGPRVLFAGLGPTLARDVPFSAFYWLGVETTKDALRDRVAIADPTQRRVAVAFAAGVLAGAVATALTHPFDVVKTRAQLATFPQSATRAQGLWQQLRLVLSREGPAGLMAGLAPRVLKVAPACAIMIASYEGAKAAFHVNDGRNDDDGRA